MWLWQKVIFKKVLFTLHLVAFSDFRPHSDVSPEAFVSSLFLLRLQISAIALLLTVLY